MNLFTPQFPGFEDKYFNNTLIQRNNLAEYGVVGSPIKARLGVVCPLINVTNTRVFTESGVASKCLGGPSITKDGTGNTVQKLPADDDVIKWAKDLLGMEDRSDDLDFSRAESPTSAKVKSDDADAAIESQESFTQQPWLPWTVKQGNLVAGLTTFPSPKGCKPVVNGSWDPTSNCVWVADKLSPSWQACQASCGKNRACNSFDFATSWTIKGDTGECWFRSDHYFPKALAPGTDMNHTCGTRIKPDTHDHGDGCVARAKLGAGLRIHGSGAFTDLFVPDATACCRACRVPHCSTWSFGWGNGTGCHLSTGPPASTTKDPKFAGGVKGDTPAPAPPAPPSPWTAVCDHGPDPAVFTSVIGGVIDEQHVLAMNTTIASAGACCALCSRNQPACVAWTFLSQPRAISSHDICWTTDRPIHTTDRCRGLPCTSGISVPIPPPRPLPPLPVVPTPKPPLGYQPNIVLFLTDDQDETLGSRNAMPQTKRLLSDFGATASNWYIFTPVCCPSRAQYLTGRMFHRLRINGINGSLPGEGPPHVVIGAKDGGCRETNGNGCMCINTSLVNTDSFPMFHLRAINMQIVFLKVSRSAERNGISHTIESYYRS